MSYRAHRLRELSEVLPALQRALDLYEQIVCEEATRGHFAATRERIELLQQKTAGIIDRVQVEIYEHRNRGRHEDAAACHPIQRRLRVSSPAAGRARSAGARV